MESLTTHEPETPLLSRQKAPPAQRSARGRTGLQKVRRGALALAPRLLIIDDDDDLLQMARGILGADGYLVDTAYAALDGVHKALRFPPDAILLDVLMSGCDGLEVFDTLRQHERTCSVPILALSTLAGPDASRLLTDVGFAALIEKPVSWPALRRELRRIVGQRTC
jgi:CheY-like chemotaxis protein